MTRSAIILFSFLALFSLASLTSAQQSDSPERVKKLLNQVDDLWRGESSYAVTSMRVKTEHYTRTMRMEGWSKGK